LFTMDPEIKKDSEYLVLYFLLWAGVNLWVLIRFPQLKEFDVTKFTGSELGILFLFSAVSLYGLVMSAVYVNRIQKFLNIGGFTPGAVTVFYVLSVALLGLLSFVFIMYILWKVRNVSSGQKQKPDKGRK
jgi:hypothetical protein